MVMIEFKEAAIDRVFGLLEESIENNKTQKMTLCELEDVLHDAIKDSGEDSMMGLRSGYRSGYRSSMRGYGYRRGMRDYHDENRYAY